jgi:predicted DsbA family dithiol-disulfide isomerase
MTPLNIDIVSDVVCPWCFVGKRRLACALELLRAERPDLAVTVRWLPFFLNPNTPPVGEPYRPFLERKFGGPAAVEALWERVRAAGRSVGLELAFEKISVRANTLQAHRLLHWAQQRGDANELVERLFAAHFQHGEHVGDAAVLQRIAVECGYPATDVAAYLASDADADAVRVQERHAREKGVSSVPTFFFGGKDALSGAETPETLADAIRRHLNDVAAV